MAVSMIMPTSAGIPTKLRKVMEDPLAIQINGFYFNDYDESISALIWYVSSDQVAFIQHGFSVMRIGTLDKDGKAWVKENIPHPYYFETFIDGRELQLKRYAVPFNTEDGPPFEGKGWSFYHIFEPGDLAIGDHEFNMIWYLGIEDGERVVDLNLFEAYEEWMSSLGLELSALVIRVS